jgi:hypothetical protein
MTNRYIALPQNLFTEIESLANGHYPENPTTPPEELYTQLQSAQKLATLIVALPEIEDQIQDLQSQLDAQSVALSNAQQINNQHLVSIQALSQKAVADRGVINPPSEKHPDPDRFNGTRAKLRGFLGQLRLKVGDRSRFPTDQDQLQYAANRLEGAALDQILLYLKDNHVNLDNLAVLICILENAFDDPDRMGTAERTLRNLQQNNRDFATYYAEFQRYAPDTAWDNAAKRFALREGLSRELQMALIHRDEPEGLQEFVALCQQIDQKLRRFMPQNRTNSVTQSHSASRAPQANQTTTASTATGTHPGPMDLSAIRRQLQVTQEGKTTRLREGRCLYCGGLGHMARECPNKRPKPLQTAATTTTSPTESGNVLSHV